ncbi:MAG: hypothetical protein ABIS67_10585, partial [Candidatus Eisenbacteria bacterium]
MPSPPRRARSKTPPIARPREAGPPQATGPARIPPWAWIAAAVATTLTAWRLAALTSLFWAQDDAYISFRYARNLLRGEGLVFNVGERVEGYTNFLWTVLSSIPMAMGQADPIT